MTSYKDFDREIKGYVEVLYSVIENANITTTLAINRNHNYTYNYYINPFTHSQKLIETYQSERILENYAVLCENLVLLDGSFQLFNKISNKNGFYSENTIDFYINNIESNGYEARDFVLEIGSKSDLISGGAYGVTIYSQNNNFVLSPHGNQVVAELYDCDGDLIETSNNTKFYSNQFSVIFDNNINDCFIKIKQFEFEYTDRPAIITHIDLGISHVYKDSELIEFTVIEEVDKLVEETPTNELDMTIGDYDQLYDPLNSTGIVKYLTEKTTFIPYIGIVLDNGRVDYTKMGEFYFNSINYQDKQVTITAYNLMNELSNVMIKNTKGSLGGLSVTMSKTNGYTVQDKISNLLKNSYNYKYEINLSTEMLLTVAWMKNCSLLSFLQKCCMYNGIIYVNRENAIVVKEIDKNIKNTLTKFELLTDVKYSEVDNYKSYYDKREYISQLTMESSSEENINNNFLVTFTLKSEEEEICISSDDPRDLAFINKNNISFSGADSVEMLTNSLSSDMNPFYYLLFLQVKGNIGNTVTISGKKPYVTKYDNKSELKKLYGANENTNITIDNDLSLSYKQSDAFIDKMYSYKVSLSYNGDPLIKAGDYIEVESNYGYLPIFVTKHSLTFNGGLSGSIEGVE